MSYSLDLREPRWKSRRVRVRRSTAVLISIFFVLLAGPVGTVFLRLAASCLEQQVAGRREEIFELSAERDKLVEKAAGIDRHGRRLTLVKNLQPQKIIWKDNLEEFLSSMPSPVKIISFSICSSGILNIFGESRSTRDVLILGNALSELPAYSAVEIIYIEPDGPEKRHFLVEALRVTGAGSVSVD